MGASGPWPGESFQLRVGYNTAIEGGVPVLDATDVLLATVGTGLAARDDLAVAEALSALLSEVRSGLDVKKNDVRVAWGRMRQVAHLHRARRHRHLRANTARFVPRIVFYAFTVIGAIVFGMAVVVILLGNLVAALPLFPAAVDARGLVPVMPWALRRSSA